MVYVNVYTCVPNSQTPEITHLEHQYDLPKEQCTEASTYFSCTISRKLCIVEYYQMYTDDTTTVSLFYQVDQNKLFEIEILIPVSMTTTLH